MVGGSHVDRAGQCLSVGNLELLRILGCAFVEEEDAPAVLVRVFV